MALLKYQQNWIEDQAPLKVYEKSRRIGITWTEAANAAIDASKKNGHDWWYLGYNKEMSEEWARYVGDWALKIHAAAQGAEEVAIEDPGGDILAYRVRFASGHKVVALSSRPSNLRGKGGIAVIDEAAYHDDLAGLLKAAIAFTMWGGRIHIISTHNGSDGEFANLINDIRSGRRPGSLHRTTLDDALADGLYHEIAKAQSKEWSYQSEMEWRQELLSEYGDDADEELFCVPSKGSGVFLSAELIESRMMEGIPVIRARGEHAFDQIEHELDHALRTQVSGKWLSFFGEDFGRSGDLTVIWPLQVSENLVRQTPFVVELRDVEFDEQRRILFYILDRLPNLVKGVLDSVGNGQYIGETTALRYGGSRVPISMAQLADTPGRIIPLLLSVDFYREAMPKMKAAFEDKKITLPRSADILADFRLLRTERGITKVPDARTRGTDAGNRHGDAAMACCLAYFASIQSGPAYSYQPVARALSMREREPYDEDDDDNSRGWGIMGRGRFGPGKGTW